MMVFASLSSQLSPWTIFQIPLYLSNWLFPSRLSPSASSDSRGVVGTFLAVLCLMSKCFPSPAYHPVSRTGFQNPELLLVFFLLLCFRLLMPEELSSVGWRLCRIFIWLPCLFLSWLFVPYSNTSSFSLLTCSSFLEHFM